MTDNGDNSKPTAEGDRATRVYRWHEGVAHELYVGVLDALAERRPVADIWRDNPWIAATGISQDGFRKWCQRVLQQRKLLSVKRRLDYLERLAKTFGVDLDALEPMDRLKALTVIEAAIDSGKPTTRLKAVQTADRMKRTDLHAAADERARAKFEAWKREEDERIAKRDRERAEQAERALRGRGLPDDVADAIRDIYGLPSRSSEDSP